MPKVYEAGKAEGIKSEYDRFWDRMQNYGKRTSADSMFVWWQHEEINPKYPIPPAPAFQQTFYACSNITEHPQISTPEGGSFFYQTFYACPKLKEVTAECIGIASRNNCFHQTFWQCNSCIRIAKIVPVESHIFTNTFVGCSSLVDITCDGVIGNTINFQDCPLSVESMISIITHLKPETDPANYNTKTVYFNEDCWAKLEASGIPNPSGYLDTWKAYVMDYLYWNV